MIPVFKKLNTILILSALSAGIIFCLCGFGTGVPKGVTVNGMRVGGLKTDAAVSLVREQIEQDLKGKTLIIATDGKEYSFNYPEISYKDNIRELLASAERNGNYTAEVTYYLCGQDEIIAHICNSERVDVIEPYAEFKTFGEPFVYHEGSDGKVVDVARLKTDIQSSLGGSFQPVTVKYLNTYRKNTIQSVKNSTVLLSRFTTYFDSSNLSRASNIRLAAALINGTVLDSGKTFSFNQTVGARLPERGFLPAKIIENGEYTDGVGGGVCQVSTTLYNAALLSGMQITEYHPHSLAVGYVEPSRDAMVSGTWCDLKFTNSGGTPVYIRSRTQGGTLTFEIYGKSDGATYSIQSQITGTIPATEEFCTAPEQVREGKDGLTSQSYLLISRDGFVRQIKLRTDKYLAQKRITLAPADAQI